MYWQNTKTLRYFFALISIIVVASIINFVGLNGVDQASAQTALSTAQIQTCFDTWNGKTIDFLNGDALTKSLFNNCKAPPACSIASEFIPSKVTCINPQAAVSAAASQAVVAPLITAVCGVAPPITNQTRVYFACSNKVVADYNTCAMTGGPVTSSVVDTPTNTAKCFVAKGNKISVVDAIKAITTGRAAGDAITTKAANDLLIAKCTASGKVIVDGKCVTKPVDPPKTTCAIDGIGWIVCPTVNFLARVTDGSFTFLSNSFLRTDPNLFNTSRPTYKAWAMMRSIANVAFVIAFMLIIFSQMTSYGITNYGVKKLLPRLIIAAILVNVSYFVCQIAIDLSNILGFSIKEMFDGLSGKIMISTDAGAVNVGATGQGFVGLAGSILALAGAVALGYALLATLIPVLLAALVAMIMILFILVARQVLIILLVVISPLAFVAFLLPNTQPLFKKWQKAFTAMLMLFPIIALVFGVSTLASTILNTSLTNNLAGDTKHWMSQIIAAAVMILPLFIVPGLLKKSLDNVGGIGQKMNGLSGKLGGALGKRGSQGYENSALGRGREARKQGKAEFHNRSFTRAAAGDDKSLMGRMRRRTSKGVMGRTFTDAGDFAQDKAERAAKGAFERAEAKDYSEAVEAATAVQRNFSVGDVATIAATGKHNGLDVTEGERAAAIDRTMSQGGFSQRTKVLEALAKNKSTTSRELRSRAVSGSYAKNDQNIFGTGFGDQILEDYQPEVRDAAGKITVAARGTINGDGDLAAAAVDNAADGHVSAEHMVQNSSATEYLVGATINSGNAMAYAKLKEARVKAETTATTQGKIDDVIKEQFERLV